MSILPVSKLTLTCGPAGSERIAKTEAEGQRLVEAVCPWIGLYQMVIFVVQKGYFASWSSLVTKGTLIVTMSGQNGLLVLVNYLGSLPRVTDWLNMTLIVLAGL